MTVKKIQEFLFKAPVPMVLGLSVDVSNDIARLGRTNGKYAIPALPSEVAK